MVTKRLIHRINQNLFFKDTNKTNKPLAKLTKRKGQQKTQDSITKEEKGRLLQTPMKSRESLGNTVNTHIKALENLKEMDIFPGTYDLPSEIKRI